MFNFSGSEIVFLLLIALIVLGPEKLPEAVRKFGKTYAEFKKMTTGFQSELKSALDEPMREMRETADAFKKAASFDFDAEPDQPETTDQPETPTDAAAEPAATVAPPATASPATFSAAPPLKPTPPDEAAAVEPAPDEAAAVEPATDEAATVDPAAAADEPVRTGLDAVVVRDAPVQGGAPARVPPARPASVPESPPIAAPVVRRAPRKNTAASFRRAPKNHHDHHAATPAAPDAEQAASAGSAPPLAPRPDGDDGRAAGA